MKQSDIFTLILIAGIGTLAAFFVCNAIMGNPDEAYVSFKALTNKIDKSLAAPDPEIFNNSAINPTIEVYIGDCVDSDGNGLLDAYELKTCGKVEAPVVGVETAIEELEELKVNGDYCITTAEEKTLCENEKIEYIDKLLQERENGEGQTGGE